MLVLTSIDVYISYFMFSYRNLDYEFDFLYVMIMGHLNIKSSWFVIVLYYEY